MIYLGRILLLTILCVISYAPTLTIPLSGDDYPNISQSRTYGSVKGIGRLWSDSTFRLRATSYWVMFSVWSHAGLSAKWSHGISLLLHIVSTLLLYSLAAKWAPMRKGAIWGAAFFAVYEGHQEAVMWYSAVNELLLFVFGIGAIVCWARAVKSLWWHVPGVILFGLALISKESAIIMLPLLLLVRWQLNWTLVPYLAGAGVAALSIAESRANSFRFSDGSFSVKAPFWITLPHSTFRLLWIWGLVAVLVWIARKQPARPLWLGLVWVGLALWPYCFLTYSTAIPSRQIYLASAGIAMVVGLVFQHLAETSDRRLVYLVGAVIIAENIGVLWVKKRPQFLERAAPTEYLLESVRATKGEVYIKCFRLLDIVAEEAVRLAAPEELPRLVAGSVDTPCGGGARD